MSDARRPDDWKVRARALDPACSFIVQAPAGSGKTELLIQRYLRLLPTVTAPEEILAITFTRKAAAEMRNRVLAALDSATGPEPESEHARQTWQLARDARAHADTEGWQLVEHPSRMRIFTIDALNAALARQMPVLSRLGGMPATSERPQELYREAARATLAELDAGDDNAAHVAHLLRHLDGDQMRAEQLLAEMLAHREQWLVPILDARESARSMLEAVLEREITGALRSVCQALPPGSGSEIAELATYAAGNLKRAEIESPILACAGLDALPGDTSEQLPAWLGIAELLMTKDGGWRKSPNKTVGMPADDKTMKARMQELLATLADATAFAANLHVLRALPPARFTDRQWEMLAALTDLLPRAAAQLQLVFAARSEVDFSEVAQAALQALGEPQAPTDLALALDYRMRHILVDEFQDTSARQYALLAQLTNGWTGDDGRTLFVVGDPMQSIYRFREAEVGLYLQARAQGIGNLALEPLRLSVNFRSQAGIVDWVNKCFREVMPAAENIADGAVAYAESVPFDPSRSSAAVSVHPAFARDSAQEADRVLEIVQASLREGGSTAILVRARPHLAAIVPRLRAEGLPVRALGIERLADRPVVQDLLALTRALLHPADRTAWLALLRAPWGGLTLADLLALAGDDPTALIGMRLDSADISKDGHARLQRVQAALESALANRARRNLRDMVEGAWLKLGGPACVPESAWGDADAFFELLEGLEQAADLDDPPGLEEAFGELWAAPDPNAGDALQVMTMHQAKGLEFDHVILPGLGRRPRNASSPLLIWMQRPREHGLSDLLIAPLHPRDGERDPVYEYVRGLQQRRDRLEQGRLLYVAATRARRRLHLLGHVTPRVDKEGEISLPAPAATTLLAQLWSSVCGEFERAFDTAAEAPGSPIGELPTVEASLQRLVADWRLPSAPDPVATTPPQAMAADDGIIEFRWAGETARRVGTVVHRALQIIAREGAAAWPAERLQAAAPAVRALLVQGGVGATELDAALARCLDALTRTLGDSTGRWLLDPGHADAHSEYALSAMLDGRLVTGIIDRSFVDADGVRWIVDYKTGAHEGGSLETFLAAERERYAPQLARYARLVRAREQRPVRLALYFPLLAAFTDWAAPATGGSDD